MGPSSELFLSFYGLVCVHVSGPRALISFLRSEWGRFELPESRRDPDIWIRWGNGRARPAYPQSNNSRTKLAGWYKGCLWRATVEKTDASTLVEYSSMPPSNFLFKDSCIEPLLLASLESKGLHGLHASSLGIGKNAWVFCGEPRSGKTILGLMGARSGHAFLSDDVALLGDGMVYPYLAPPRVYLHNMRDRELFQELIFRHVSPDLVRNLLVSLVTLGRLRVPTRLTSANEPHNRLLASERFPLGGLFLLKAHGQRPGVSVVRDESAVLRDVSLSPPIHGASILDQIRGDGKELHGRPPALEAEVKRLVDAGRVFEIRGTHKLSMHEWVGIFNEVVDNAKGFS